MEDRTSKVVDSLKELCKGIKKGPTRILLDPTDRCNLKCVFCWQRGATFNYSKELSDKKLLRLVREAAELNAKEWVISGGGDPLTRKIIFEVMKKIKKHGMWGQVITNGLLFKKEGVKKLIDMKWDHVQISLDGAKAKTHNLLRASDNAFERIKTVLSCFKTYKEKSESSNPSIGFNTVICNENHNQLHKIIKIAHKYHVEQVWFEMIAPWSESAKRYLLTDEQKNTFKRYAKKADKIAKKYRIFTNISYYLDNDQQYSNSLRMTQHDKGLLSAFCLAPWFSMKIHPTGVVGPCCTFYRNEPLGNLHRESLKKIWEKNFEALQKAMLKKKPPKYCEECTKGQIAEIRDIKIRLASTLEN